MGKLFSATLFLAVAAVAQNKIPAGAKPLSPGFYSHTDAQGKSWIYRETPFGVYKLAPSDVDRAGAKDTDPPAVIDLGDSVRFERKTPFGLKVWTMKKSELSEEERALIQPKPVASQTESR